MTPEDQDRFDAISAALARMTRRQEELERRLAQLERERGVGILHSSPPSEPVPPLEVPPPLPETTAAPPLPPPSGASVPPGPPTSGVLETALGLKWVSRIAVVTAVLALAFFFQYAFEKRWITETGRVLLGVGAGMLALLLGERFHRVGASVYGQALTAAGVSFLYLSIWAAYGPYRLLLYPAAFGLMVLTTALAGSLALRYGSPTVAALGSAGGFLTPLLLAGRQETWFVLAYALLLGGAGVWIARRKHWNWLQALCLIGAAALYIGQMPIAPSDQWPASAFVFAAYALFLAPGWPPVMAAAQVLAPLTLAGLWTPSAGALWGALVMTTCGLAAAEARRVPSLPASFVGFWIAWTLWRAQAPPGSGASAGLALLAAYALFLVFSVWIVSAGRRRLGMADLVLAVLNPGFAFGAAYWWLGERSSWAGGLAVGMAVAEAVSARLMWARDPRASRLAAGVAWVLLTAAVPIQLAGYRVTMAWSMEAAALAWIASRLRRREALMAAAVMFALVCGRLALVDSAMYPATVAYSLIINARFLSFAAAAAGFWAAAWWIGAGREALAAFLAGHAVMLWALFLEAAGWAARVAAPENVASVATASISVIAGAYALGLVTAGAYRRSAAARILGIALIGGVVLKLYLYDVWLLRAFYRMTAFAILGVLLWAMAYLYSRFRNSIESWWRKS